MEVVAIIPARAGSKELPRKNVRELLGKPLLAYSIEAALASCSITRTVVSTDSEEIASVARRFGAEVPFLRPPELAADDTPMVDVIDHALKALYPASRDGGSGPDWVIILQPTSPLRTHEHIDVAFKRLLEMKGDSLVSVCTVSESPYWMFGVDRFGFLRPILRRRVSRRQELPAVFRLNGAIYVTQPGLVTRGRLLGERVVPFVMSRDESIDIDSEDDLRAAEHVLRRKGNLNS